MPRSATDPKWLRTCPVCSTRFHQRKAKQIYCSRQCAEQERPSWARPRGGIRAATGLDPRTCLVCGSEYRPMRVSQLACSRKCRDALPEQRRIQRERDNSVERRDRQNVVRRERYRQDPEKVRAYNRKHNLRKYGLTVEDYDRLLAAQNGVCAICGSPPNPEGVRAASRLHPDHDHETGRNRALLCLNCNVGIGHFRDDPDLMQAAADYIKRHREAVAEGSQ